MTLQLLAVLVLGLMCGSELNVAAFGHPTLNRQPLAAHILVRSSFAALFGQVMPFWMGSYSYLSSTSIGLPGASLQSLSLSKSSLSCSRSSVRYPSIIALPNGRRNPSLTTRKRRSIVGMCTIGSERVDWL